MTSTSTLYQGLQSCLEPTLVEPNVVMNKLTPTKSNFPQEEGIDEEKSFNDLENQVEMSGGWSFIQALANVCQYPKKEDRPEVYVHPLVKLNTKSLEMCTESLGSETGSDISESIEELLSEKETNFHGTQRSRFAKKLNRAGCFPPPLTSMSGNEGVQVRPHREGGRLVIKAVTINSYFQTERVDGRLRLSLLKHDDECSHEEEDQENDDEGNGSRKLASQNIGVGEYARPSRCKASGSRSKGIPSWEPFWVAIS